MLYSYHTHTRTSLFLLLHQVKSLIVEGRRFEQEKVTLISEKVGNLQAMHAAIESGGSHGALNELRALNTAMMNKWKDFENNLQTHMTNLDLSLKFQETLFEVHIDSLTFVTCLTCLWSGCLIYKTFHLILERE